MDGDLTGVNSATADQLFSHGGEMGARMRVLDWTATALGLPAVWPRSLRSALSICLGSSFPIAIYWGPTLSLLYNDAWSPILGAKHPWGLGRPAAEAWPEIWDTIGPLFDHVMTTGEATYREDQLLPMRRHGYTEECYFNYSFSPIRGEADKVEGIFNAVIETTFRVIAERRTRVLRELGEGVTSARSSEQACAIATGILGAASKDVPFCAVYLVDEAARVAKLAASTVDDLVAPPIIALDDATQRNWPLARVRETGQVELVTHLDDSVAARLPLGPWPEPSNAALVARCASAARRAPRAF